jgi:hypothetical protein
VMKNNVRLLMCAAIVAIAIGPWLWGGGRCCLIPWRVTGTSTVTPTATSRRSSRTVMSVNFEPAE